MSRKRTVLALSLITFLVALSFALSYLLNDKELLPCTNDPTAGVNKCGQVFCHHKGECQSHSCTLKLFTLKTTCDDCIADNTTPTIKRCEHYQCIDDDECLLGVCWSKICRVYGFW